MSVTGEAVTSDTGAQNTQKRISVATLASPCMKRMLVIRARIFRRGIPIETSDRKRKKEKRLGSRARGKICRAGVEKEKRNLGFVRKRFTRN